jgi:sporulation protein YlmC with PRC-barrel domain
VPKELTPEGITDAELRTPGIEEAIREAREIEGRDVFDANGLRVGRVVKSFVDGGRIVGHEVRLDRNTKGMLNVDKDTTEVRPEWISRVEEDGVRLGISLGQIVLPFEETARTGGEGGSDTFPRKTR